MTDPFRRPTFGPALIYKDPAAALDWLEAAFGFECSMVIRDGAGMIVHAELRFGDGYIMIGPEWTSEVASPASMGGRNTQSVHVLLEGDVDAHCERARSAGAVILQEPEDQFYGDRAYRAKDPEGHLWSFARPVRRITREEAERANGLQIEGWP